MAHHLPPDVQRKRQQILAVQRQIEVTRQNPTREAVRRITQEVASHRLLPSPVLSIISTAILVSPGAGLRLLSSILSASARRIMF
jgi:hypothetical protein